VLILELDELPLPLPLPLLLPVTKQQNDRPPTQSSLHCIVC